MHKTGNVLDKMPKGVQKKAKSDLHEIWMAETKEEAEQAFNLFINKYQAKHSKAVESPKDRETLLTLYDFPAYIPSILELLTQWYPLYLLSD